jgi:hypothetical protein
MYSVGAEKVKEAISALDRASQQETDAKALGYNLTIEDTFTSDNELVTLWTKRFEQLVQEQQIFSKFYSVPTAPSERAAAVGSLWHGFSSFVPWFLCQACAKVSTNEKRHYVIQTAFEELGMRNSREIHADMFWDAAASTGLTNAAAEQINGSRHAKSTLDLLKNDLLSYNTDEEVLGILLGLEIPAIENIDAVFRSLTYTEGLRLKLSHHKFFKLHRQIEIEHVRLTVANFLRFCPNEDQQERFLIGFMDGLKFWKNFWDNAADTAIGVNAEAST